MTRKQFCSAAALVASLTLLPSNATWAAPSKDIVATAQAAGSFKTLVKALQAADLVTVLQGKGPFTVFAPSDAAFAKLPPGALDGLLKDKKKLAAVLTYHVVPGEFKAAQVVKGSPLKTVQGETLQPKVEGGQAFVNNAKITKTDILCSNGVIHVIDTVLMPK